MKTNCLFLFFLLLFNQLSAQTAQFATAGTGNMRNYISWFNWAGTSVSNNNSYNFTTDDGLVVNISFSNVTGPSVTPFVMNTWSGAVLWQLYDFTDPAIKPALFSQQTVSQVKFTMNITATRAGVPADFTFVAADAEGSDQTESTTFSTSGTSWRTIEFFRNSAQTSNPLTNCGTQSVNLSLTYGGSPQTGQNPILATDGTGSLTITTQMNRSSIGGMAVAFGIFSPIDRGDLPSGYGFAQHSIKFSTVNSCNFNPPFPSISQDVNLKLGSVPGDADGAQTLNDNASGKDEEAISTFPYYNGTGSYSLNVPLSNSSGSDAYLCGWFDFNRNGAFENSERITATVPDGATSANLTWTGLPTSFQAGSVIDFGFRFRLSSNQAESQNATGYARDGEVEDYLVSKHFLMSTEAAFTLPDTVCTNTPLSITNTSTGASTFFWNFCSPDGGATPTGTNLGNAGSLALLQNPGHFDYVKENGNYYAFVTSNPPGRIIRLNFGNSLLNTPTASIIGSLTGVFPYFINGIQVIKNEGNWNLVMVGTDQAITQSRLYTLDLGTDISNISPIFYDWGNIGGLNNPQDLQVILENGSWHGVTVNAGDNTVTRFDFGQSFAILPVGTNLGNPGNMNVPGGLNIIHESATWFLFVTNSGNSTISRIDFGNSILNPPTGINLGNPDNLLHGCSDIQIMPFCDEGIAYVVNKDPGYNDLVKLNFGASFTNTPVASTNGNVGNLSTPSSISSIMRFGNDLYSFITNPATNTLTRLKFSGCNNASTPSSDLENPLAYAYNAPGTYYVQLIADEGLPSQSRFCKQIVVQAPPVVIADPDTAICFGDTIVLHVNASNATSISWSPSNGLSATDIADPVASPSVSTQYFVTVSNSHCTVIDTINLTVRSLPIVNLGNDTSMCKVDSIQFNAGSPGGSYSWQDGSSSQSFNAKDSGQYAVEVTLNGCVASDTVHVAFRPDPVFSVRSDTSICKGTSVLLSTQAAGNYQYNWNPSSGLSSPTDPSPTATINNPIRYYVIATNDEGCSQLDSVDITDIPLPVVNLGNDTLICSGQSITLDAGNAGASFLWNDGISTQTNAIAAAGIYSVTVTDNNGCKNIDSVTIGSKPFPVFTIDPGSPSLCATDSVLIRASGAIAYNWFTPDGPLNVSDSFITAYPTISTEYFVAVRDPICNIADTLTAVLDIKPAPQVSINKENDINCLQPAARLLATGGIDYQWTPAINISEPHTASPVVSPQADTWYHVHVTDDSGCSSEDSILVQAHFDGTGNFFVPSAFTPNNDGKNDCFGVSYWGPSQDFELNIYNRWGELVFHTSNFSDCWNGYYKGKLQPTGVYVYYIKVNGPCGTAFKKGTVTIIY